jgi:hypothetical protein
MDWVFKKLELKNMESWYNVKNTEVRELGGSFLPSSFCYSHTLTDVLAKQELDFFECLVILWLPRSHIATQSILGSHGNLRVARFAHTSPTL